MLEKMIEHVKSSTGVKNRQFRENTRYVERERELSIFGKILIIKTLAISKKLSYY